MDTPPTFTYGYFARYLIIRLLVIQAIVLVLIGLDWTRSFWLLFYAGFLIGAFLVRLILAKPHRTRLGGAGCLLVMVALLISGALGCASWLASVADIPSTSLAEHAAALFTLVLLLGPITMHWMELEECYYQVYLAEKLERDLGFKADTNTLEGTWPTGRKYLFFDHIQQGGAMDQAGFLPKDIVVDDGSFTDFWQRLEESRGGPPIPITVASWVDPGPVSKRTTRQISVRVPRKGYRESLEKELGFRCDVRYFKENGSWQGVVIVTNLQQAGWIERAGFQDRDILLNVGGVPTLFEKLEQARGLAPVTLEVVSWLDPSDLAERPVRELFLEVPPRAQNQSRSRWCDIWIEEDLQRDLGFKVGWECLPHRGEWHGWPIVEDLQPEGLLARAGFQNKDILLESFSWRRRWHTARGKGPISVKVVAWMEPTPIRKRVRRQLKLGILPARQSVVSGL